MSSPLAGLGTEAAPSGSEPIIEITPEALAKLKEQGGNTLQSRFYTDAQLRFTPSFWDDRFGFAVGANNIFNTKAPGCVTCDINNFDPTVYDVPGRYYYAKVSVKM